MKRIPLGVLLLVVVGACEARSQAPKTDDEKTLYALGLSIGRNLAVFNLSKAELQFVFQGMTDQVTGAKPDVDVNQFGPKIQALARARGNAKADAEKAKGEAYVAKVTADEKGAVKTATGLVYIEETPGTGDAPVATDRVKVNYRGTLIDGTEFDSSYKRNQPAEFTLTGVVPCWTEGIQKMKVGGKAKLICPSKLAYQDRGQPPNIPGGATLIFEVELLGVTKPQAPAPGQPGAPGQPSMSMGQPGMPPMTAMHPPLPAGHPLPQAAIHPAPAPTPQPGQPHP